MSADSPKISVGMLDRGLYVNLHGRATQRVCPTVDAALNEYLGEGGEAIITLDLKDCAWVDSTFAGWMAGVAKRVARSSEGLFRIWGCGERCRASLEKMQLLALFQFGEGTPPALQRELSCTTTDRPDKSAIKLMLEAHQELAGLSESNNRIFGPVVSALRRQLDG